MKQDRIKKGMLRPQEKVSPDSLVRSVISAVKISINVNCVQPRTLFVIIAARKDTLKLSVCKFSKFHEVQSDEMPGTFENSIFLAYVLDVCVNNTEIKFKGDTGANVDIISNIVYTKSRVQTKSSCPSCRVHQMLYF